jgi:hypothetical protein
VERAGPYADFPDPAPVQVLAVEANTFDREVPWSVPMLGRIRAYFQFLPGEDVEAVLREVEASLHDFAQADAFFRRHPVRFERVLDPPLHGHEQPADHPWTACLLGGAGNSRPAGAGRRLAVAVRRLHPPALRDADAALRPEGRGQPQRERIRGGELGAADGRDLPGRRARVVCLRPA